MIVNQQQLYFQLKKKKPASFYLILGDEMQLVNDSCDMIKSCVKSQADLDQANLESNVFVIDQHFDTTLLWQSIIQPPLFSDKRLLKCHLMDLKFANKIHAFLAKLTQSQLADVTFLLIAYTKNHKNFNKKLYNWFEQHGVVVQLNRLKSYQFPNWIEQRLHSYGLEADSEAIKVLAEYSENNSVAAAQAIERLSLLYGSGSIAAEQIIYCLSAQSKYDVFQLADSALAGKGAQLIAILQSLKQEGVEPTIILWAICRDLRLLITLGHHCQSQPISQVLEKEQLWSWRKKLIGNVLRKHSIDFFRNLLQYAMEIDAIIKGHVKGNVWDGLQRLCLSLAGINPESRRVI